MRKKLSEKQTKFLEETSSMAESDLILGNLNPCDCINKIYNISRNNDMRIGKHTIRDYFLKYIKKGG